MSPAGYQPAQSGQNAQQSSARSSETCRYAVKVVNQKKRSEYTVHRLQLTEKFAELALLKEALLAQCDFIKVDQIGYIEAGHGAKGRQIWLQNDIDLKEMYGVFGSKEMLWCFKSDSLHYRSTFHHSNNDNEPPAKKVY